MMLLAPLVVTAQLLLVADRPPALDVEPSCRAAERSGIEGRTSDSCMRGENQAKATLNDKWAQFSARQQARCTSLVQMGGTAELCRAADLPRSGRAGRQDPRHRPDARRLGLARALRVRLLT